MKTFYSVCLFVVLAVLSGCRDKEEPIVGDKTHELAVEIGNHFAMMKNANVEGRACADRIMQELLSVTDPMQRKQLFNLWRQTALKFDYHALPFGINDPRRGRSMSMMDDLFVYVFPRAADSEEEKWHIKLEYLGWLRARANSVAGKRPYPKGVFANGQNRLAKEHGYRNALIEYRSWLDRYNGCSQKYEWELVGLEMRFLDEKANMASETAKRITDEIERFLGRKIRTKEQCDADFYAKRRVEFPKYVPTPEGLKDEWTEEHW